MVNYHIIPKSEYQWLLWLLGIMVLMWWSWIYQWLLWLPSGKHTKNYGLNHHFYVGKSTICMMEYSSNIWWMVQHSGEYSVQ